MSTIKSTSGNLYTGITSNLAEGRLAGQSAPQFADPALTPLATPLVGQPAKEASVPFLVEDQNLLRILQAIVLRSDSVCAQAFSCGSYTRPTAQLEAVFKSIAVSLTSNQADFPHHG